MVFPMEGRSSTLALGTVQVIFYVLTRLLLANITAGR